MHMLTLRVHVIYLILSSLFCTTLIRHLKRFFSSYIKFQKMKSTEKSGIFKGFAIFLDNSALLWGGRGRRFKSGHSDQRKPTQFRGFFGIAWVFCVSENQMLGHYEGTIFLKSYKKIQQHTTKKPPTETPEMLPFC